MNTHFKKNCKALILVLLLLPMSFASLTAGCVYAKPLTATEVEMGNMLTWSTSSETTTANFQIQKSEDGILFSPIGEVEAAGNSDNEKKYRFLDPAIGDTKVYYRMLQVDADDRSTFTHIAVLNKTNKNDYLITMMGNTTTERYFNLVMNSKKTGLMNYRIENLDNKVMKKGEARIIEGSNLLMIDLHKLADDKYQCVFVMDNEEERIYLVKGKDEPMVKKK